MKGSLDPAVLHLPLYFLTVLMNAKVFLANSHKLIAEEIAV